MRSIIDFVTTDDGSHSLYNTEIQEGYHSTHGAILESKHIFINAGLNLFKNAEKDIHVLEIGFGTGLNALLSYLWATRLKKDVLYFGIEAFPINQDILRKLNYPELLAIEKSVFLNLHKTGEFFNKISSYFSMHLNQTKIQSTDLPADHFHVVYFDAFSPSVQPEMWTDAVFKKIFSAMRKGGVLTTYSTKGDVKRTLTEVGFLIEKIPGPAGKREVLRAFKQ